MMAADALFGLGIVMCALVIVGYFAGAPLFATSMFALIALASFGFSALGSRQ